MFAARRSLLASSSARPAVRSFFLSPRLLQTAKPGGDKTVGETVSETVDTMTKKATEMLQSARATAADLTGAAKEDFKNSPTLRDAATKAQNLSKDASASATNLKLDGEKKLTDGKLETEKLANEAKKELEKK